MLLGVPIARRDAFSRGPGQYYCRGGSAVHGAALPSLPLPYPMSRQLTRSKPLYGGIPRAENGEEISDSAAPSREAEPPGLELFKISVRPYYSGWEH